MNFTIFSFLQLDLLKKFKATIYTYIFISLVRPEKQFKVTIYTFLDD